jgi:hypothetical protein
MRREARQKATLRQVSTNDIFERHIQERLRLNDAAFLLIEWFDVLPNATALDQVQNGKYDDCPAKCYGQSDERKFFDAAYNAELIGNQITDYRTDATGNDIPDDAHRSVPAHHHAGQPPCDAADNNCNNPTHIKSPLNAPCSLLDDGG